MRFSCDRCSTKYTVADEKVRGKVVAVRCTRCGHKITVNGKSLLLPPEEETRVAPLNLEALRASLGAEGPPASASAANSAPALPSGEEAPLVPASPLLEGWYVIIAGAQQGPVPPAELQAHLAAARIGPRTYVWRDGQGDWKRATDVPEFAALLPPRAAEAGASAPPPPPPDAVVGAPSAAVASIPKNGTGGLQEPAGKAALSASAQPGPGAPQAPGEAAGSSPGPGAAAAPAAGAPPGGGAAAPSQPGLDKLLFEGMGPPTGAGIPLEAGAVAAGDLERKAAAAADPFASVPDSPALSKPGEIGEQTRFFINQAGVNRRNPPWKIALGVLLTIGLPIAVLYGLTQMKVVQLEITRVDESTGAEVKTSVFSSEGMSGLKDILLGNKKAAAKKALPAGAVAQADRKPGPAAKAEVDDPRIQRPKMDFGAPMNDAQRERAAEIYKGGGVLSLEGPKVRSDRLQDKQAVDGKAGLEPAVIAETIGKNAKAFQTCVETELRRNPGFRGGKVLITASVRPSGIVTASSINRPEVDGSTVGTCLKEKARRMVFPAFEGDPFDIEIPLVLTAGE